MLREAAALGRPGRRVRPQPRTPPPQQEANSVSPCTGDGKPQPLADDAEEVQPCSLLERFEDTLMEGPEVTPLAAAPAYAVAAEPEAVCQSTLDRARALWNEHVRRGPALWPFVSVPGTFPPDVASPLGQVSAPFCLAELEPSLGLMWAPPPSGACPEPGFSYFARSVLPTERLITLLND